MSLEIAEMFAAIGCEPQHPDRWCAAYVGSQLKKRGFLAPKTVSAADYLKYGVEVPLICATVGDIVVLNLAPYAKYRHVAFFKARNPAENTITVTGGAHFPDVDKVTDKTFHITRVLRVARGVR